MRQAIVTKYLGATETRGSRVKATCYGGSVVVPWNYELDAVGNHRCAAVACAIKFGWLGPNDPIGQTFDQHYRGGSLPDDGYAWVSVRK